MSNLFSKKNVKVLLIPLAVLFLGAYFLNFFKFEEVKEFHRDAATDIISYQDLPENMMIRASLEMDGAVSPLDTSDGHFSLSTEQRVKFKLPYAIKATLQSDNGQYHDISWSVDARGVDYYILADGFKPEDTITLTMNEQKLYTIPFDWSGRIELPIHLIIEADAKACIEINDGSQKFGFCHAIAGRKA